jgi:hypothetical protein
MVSWNGDCWRAAVALRVINELEIVVVDIDHGVGVIRKRPNTHRLPSEWEMILLLAGGWDIMHGDGDMPLIEEISYQELDANREVLLRLMSMNGLRRWLHNPDNAASALQYNLDFPDFWIDMFVCSLVQMCLQEEVVMQLAKQIMMWKCMHHMILTSCC